MESWYETSEFDAIISILGTLTGCSCIGAVIYAFCKKKLCWKEAVQTTKTNDKTQEMVETHVTAASTSEAELGYTVR